MKNVVIAGYARSPFTLTKGANWRACGPTISRPKWFARWSAEPDFGRGY